MHCIDPSVLPYQYYRYMYKDVLLPDVLSPPALPCLMALAAGNA